jgi:hypothetical protein
MKFFATLAIASLAVVSAQEQCPSTLLTLATTSPEATACTADSGFSAASALASFPTGDVVTKACASANCMSLLKKVNEAVPTECTIGSIKVKEALLSKIEGACKGAAPGGKAGSGSGAGAAVIKAPTPSSAKPTDGSKPKEDVAAGSGGSAKPAASQAAKPVPSPTPSASKSGASTVAAATGAVVLAVAATML